MFRRIVAIFVTVGFISGQWLAVPHAHGEATQDSGHRHSTSPHVHLSWFSADSTAHEHAHHGHDHGDCQHGPKETRRPAVAAVVGTNHDADALYVSVSDSILGSAAGDGYLSLTMAKALPALALIPVGGDSPLGFGSCRQEMPEFRAPNCALYLQLRTLRI